jgi:methyltransferase (TIGR00027 family)
MVDRVRAEQVPSDRADRMTYEMVRRTGLTMVPRTVAIDEAIRDHAATQLVIVGAGLDTRAWRMSDLAEVTVFEIDHPASQRDKLRRIGERVPIARRVVPVEADLATEQLGPALEGAGFDRHRVTTWVWEGVVPYLTAAQVHAAVGQIALLSTSGSRLIVNYQAKSLLATVMRRAMRLVLRVARQTDPLAAEPWRSLWRPDGIGRVLSDGAFDVISDSDLLILSRGLALPSVNTGSLRNGRVAVAVRH